MRNMAEYVIWEGELRYRRTSNPAAVWLGANVEKGFSPKGKKPVLCQTVSKGRINMISAITNQEKVRFMFYKENMNSKSLIKFMRV